MRHCTGKGGLLAYMEVASPACISTAALGSFGGPNLSAGAIVGIVIGVVAAVVLLSIFMCVQWRRE
jgi:hypothetical protein